jgi:5S rRNA maturation endonuclease (ribonuclease M5)
MFEGFFDYLAFLSHYKITDFQNSAIILNSTSLRKRALAEINQFHFSKVYLFLDNDVAGDDCKRFFKLGTDGVKVIDKSFLYENYQDFNDWLIDS